MLHKKSNNLVVVLGCPPLRNGEISETLRIRMDKGIETFKKQHAKYLLVSGGKFLSSHFESQCMADYAISKNIPEKLIIQERHSRNTVENAIYIKKIIAKLEIGKIFLVTSKFHLPRSTYVFNKLGILPIPVPAQNTFRPHSLTALKYKLLESINSLLSEIYIKLLV